MKKYALVLSCISIVLIIVFISIYKNNTKENALTKINTNEVPIKINKILYSVEKLKNTKGQICLYLKANNRSDIDILSLSVDVTDGEKLDTTIEYLETIKAGETTDNFYGIENSKDYRTRIPVKDTEGQYVSEIGNLFVKEVSYVINKNGSSKIIKYNNKTKEYQVGQY